MKKFIFLYFFILIFLIFTDNIFALEDFSTYTESDSNSRITVTSTKAERILYQACVGSVYKDFGVGYFDTFTSHQFTSYLTYYSTYNEVAIFWGLSDTPEANDSNLDEANKGVTLENVYFGSRFIRLKNYNGDSSDTTSDEDIVSDGTVSYYTVTKTSDTVTVSIYSDSERTTLEDTLSVSVSDSYRYLSVLGSNSAGYMSWYTENLDLGSEEVSRRFILIQ